MQSAQAHTPHIPVMLNEVMATLQPRDGEVYVDGTFGAGGYTRALLESADCTVYAIDRDPDAICRAKDMAQEYPGRLFPLPGCFGDMRALLQETPHPRVNGIVLDIGVSSMQIDTDIRGFSFKKSGPLDMRMSQSGISAADVVNNEDEEKIADILYTYGEERASRRIAKKIVMERQIKCIETTDDLVRIIHDVLPMHGGMKTDTATRSFQALRIYVNDELGELDRALGGAADMLHQDGRLVVVTFHSLEDARVKSFFRDNSGRSSGVSRHMPVSQVAEAPPLFRVDKNSGLKPSESETRQNPRARSAHLRWGIRTAAQTLDGGRNV